jgi:cytochrome oxidase Cu insertion factor (SCO1/SenC/PrrC family)
MFDSTKTRFLLLGTAVVGLGVILGTALWLKLAPHSRLGIEQTDSANGVKQYGSVPEFTLTERDGSIVSLQQLRGKIWVADFIYTSCTDTCPLQSAMMAKLQQEYATKPDFQLVSVTVDPERDTPQALTSYATKFQADGKRWYFLTGPRDRIVRLWKRASISRLPLFQATPIRRVSLGTARALFWLIRMPVFVAITTAKNRKRSSGSRTTSTR